MIDHRDRRAPRIVVLGRQGAGKGEQCRRLAGRMDLDHVSTGDLLRAAARAGSDLGRASETFLARGERVPDHLVAGLVAERVALASAEGRGILLDGYPRTVAQAEQLVALAGADGLDLAINIEVPRAIAVERIQNRRVCTSCHAPGTTVLCARCGSPTDRRADDCTPAAIDRRMSDFARDVGPLLDWFRVRGLLATIDGVAAADEVERRVNEVVEVLLDITRLR